MAPARPFPVRRLDGTKSPSLASGSTGSTRVASQPTVLVKPTARLATPPSPFLLSSSQAKIRSVTPSAAYSGFVRPSMAPNSILQPRPYQVRGQVVVPKNVSDLGSSNNPILLDIEQEAVSTLPKQSTSRIPPNGTPVYMLPRYRLPGNRKVLVPGQVDAKAIVRMALPTSNKLISQVRRTRCVLSEQMKRLIYPKKRWLNNWRAQCLNQRRLTGK